MTPLKDNARYPVSLALKHEEYELYLLLKKQGVGATEVFKKGLTEISRELANIEPPTAQALDS